MGEEPDIGRQACQAGEDGEQQRASEKNNATSPKKSKREAVEALAGLMPFFCAIANRR